jgi:Mg2+ and Co2+ transporter CorA
VGAGTLVAIARPVSIKALYARGDGRDELVDLADWKPRRIPRDHLLWADAVAADADDLDVLRQALQLSDETVDAIADGPSDPNATVLEEGIRITVMTPGDAPEDEPVPMQVLLGDEWVVTAHAAPVPFLDEHRERVRDEREVGLLTPVQFLAAVLDWHVAAFFRLAEALEREVDELDDAALRTERDLLQRLVAMRRQIARARHLVSSHRELFAEIQRPDFMPGKEEGDAELLSTVAQRLDRAGEAVANAREMLIGTFDVHMTRTAQRTNDIMKVLTLASVILLPASVVAGVMGMNFKVGFFENPDLFWAVIAGMAAIATGTIGFARWRGWL